MIYSQTSRKILYTYCKAIKKIASTKVLKIGNMKKEFLNTRNIFFSLKINRKLIVFNKIQRIKERVDTTLEIQLTKKLCTVYGLEKSFLSVVRFLASRRLVFRNSNEQFFNSHNRKKCVCMLQQIASMAHIEKQIDFLFFLDGAFLKFI